MDNIIFTDSADLLNVFVKKENLSEFVDVFGRIRTSNYRYLVNSTEDLDKIYQELYETFRTEEDYRLFSIALEKYTNVVSNDEFVKMRNSHFELSNIESKSFQNILISNEYFDVKYKNIHYNQISNIDLRSICCVNELKQFEVLMLQDSKDVNSFVERIKLVFDDVIFDNQIADSIRKLSDGFEQRKNEICYHLYCIDKEIPEIISTGIKGYTAIGEEMSIRCSPERSRSTKDADLTCIIEGKSINCELHTKMVKLSSNPPDRIYFCPCLDSCLSMKYRNKIYIYKITKHV